MSTDDTGIVPVFQSTYALDQLKRLAGTTNGLLFAQILLPVFATNLPAERLGKLKAALSANIVANPEYRVVDLGPALTAYDKQTRVIEIDRAAIETALKQPTATPALLLSLIEAFGLHIENVLRLDFIEDDQDPGPVMEQVPAELGSHYAAMLTYFDRIPENGEIFASYTSAAYEGPLRLSLPPIEDAPEMPSCCTRPKRFAAESEDPEQSHAHETIESVALTRTGFNAKQCQAIYFGNWLRDHSQLIDPKIVRAPGAIPKFPALFSRETLTRLVDFLALKKFLDLQSTPQDRNDYTVTPALLGVYRPSEHIDNPVSLDEDTVDPRTIDSEFEALVRRDDPLNSVHPKFSVMKYFKPGILYMIAKLNAAKAEGMTATGMRNFGEALHVLEDLFAHSNYVELCLRKMGHAEVAVWTTDLIGAKHRCPVVTGRFSGLDVIGSVAEPLSRILFPTNSLAFRPIVEGERSDSEKAMAILLEEGSNPSMNEAFKLALAQRDVAAKNPLLRYAQGAKWVTGLPLNAISYAKNWLMQKLAKWAGDNVGKIQIVFGSDPNIDADAIVTHSQIAKDHDTHPLHELAALLATHAVEQVARAMKEAWEGNDQRKPAYLAQSFFVHPNDTGWHESIVKEWAKDNPEKIDEASKPVRLIQRRQEEVEASLKRLEDLGKDDSYNIQRYSEILTNTFPL